MRDEASFLAPGLNSLLTPYPSQIRSRSRETIVKSAMGSRLQVNYRANCHFSLIRKRPLLPWYLLRRGLGGGRSCSGLPRITDRIRKSGYPACPEEGGHHRYAAAISCHCCLCNGVQNRRGVPSGFAEKPSGKICINSNKEK